MRCARGVPCACCVRPCPHEPVATLGGVHIDAELVGAHPGNSTPTCTCARAASQQRPPAWSALTCAMPRSLSSASASSSTPRRRSPTGTRQRLSPGPAPGGDRLLDSETVESLRLLAPTQARPVDDALPSRPLGPGRPPPGDRSPPATRRPGSLSPERGPFCAFASSCARDQAIKAIDTAGAGKHQLLSRAVSLHSVIAVPTPAYTRDAACPSALHARLTETRPLADPVRAVLAREQLDEIREALATLTPKERAALTGDLNGISQQQLASEQGWTEKAVHRPLSRARDKLGAREERLAA